MGKFVNNKFLGDALKSVTAAKKS